MKRMSTRRITQAKSCFAALGTITTRSQFGGYGLLAEGVMFAVIAEGELYLRATASMEPAFRARGMVNMVYSKRGVPITLRYYWVDESLWRERNGWWGWHGKLSGRPVGNSGSRPATTAD